MLACAVLAPASFTVGKSDAVALGRMCFLAIASPIPASSTLPDLQTIFQLRGWHVTTPETLAQHAQEHQHRWRRGQRAVRGIFGAGEKAVSVG